MKVKEGGWNVAVQGRGLCVSNGIHHIIVENKLKKVFDTLMFCSIIWKLGCYKTLSYKKNYSPVT